MNVKEVFLLTWQHRKLWRLIEGHETCGKIRYWISNCGEFPVKDTYHVWTSFVVYHVVQPMKEWNYQLLI